MNSFLQSEKPNDPGTARRIANQGALSGLFSWRSGRSRGVTITEVMIAMILIVVLFFFAYKIMDRARRETQKGFWLQKTISDLRNGLRGIAMRLKKTSYPTTIVKSGGMQIVKSYKELRTYDDSGRLRDLKVKDSTDMDLLTLQGSISPQGGPLPVMVFPMCTPETDTGSYQAGTITWAELVLQPSREFGMTQLGDLYLVEREELYDTRSLPTRAFGLNKQFNRELPVKVEKRLIEDVENMQIDVFSVDELLGIHVSDSGSVHTTMRKRFLISLRVECAHPFDGNVRIGDQCSIVIHIDVSVLAGGTQIEVLSIAGSGAGATARINFNGAEATKRINEMLGPDMRISGIFPQGISVETIPGGHTRFYFLKK